jgi:acyl-CoA dehydrogenase
MGVCLTAHASVRAISTPSPRPSWVTPPTNRKSLSHRSTVKIPLPSPQNRRSGLSILVVEKGAPGFSVGTNLKKIGLKAQDTTELFYDDVRLPAANLLGEEGKAFEYLTRNLAQERLTIAVAAMSAAATALDLTVDYVGERNVFGQPLSSG